MSEFCVLCQLRNNPACTKSVKSLHHVEVGHYTKEEEVKSLPRGGGGGGMRGGGVRQGCSCIDVLIVLDTVCCRFSSINVA